MKNKAWYQINNVDEIDSPALLIYPDRVQENIRRMIALAGGAGRLCPHVKTHKLAQLTRMQLDLGITRFKCATIAEAEMVAGAGAENIILSYQLVGPNVARFIQLARRFPKTRFSTIADNEISIRAIASAAEAARTKIPLLLDIDCGMRRTGLPAGTEAFELYRLMTSLPCLEAEGLHVYDGHLADPDFAEREKKCEAGFAPVEKMREELVKAGMSVRRMVVGGTPTFPIHARRKDVECSPGTCVLWDEGYGSRCKDLDFLHAAMVLARVVSKPGENRLCLDLGHKAIAAENPHPRVIFPDLPDARAVMHSEEHLVLETEAAAQFSPGDVLYGIPWHICPTVALHAVAVVVENGVTKATWPIEARQRRLTI